MCGHTCGTSGHHNRQLDWPLIAAVPFVTRLTEAGGSERARCQNGTWMATRQTSRN
ncbi:unnamed protein product [Ixodes persulcatus]